MWPIQRRWRRMPIRFTFLRKTSGAAPLCGNPRWSERVLLERIREYVEPHLKLEHRAYWIIDDTAHANCGRHSVGVARQYCGRLGKQNNCQVAVSLSLATAEGSVPVDYRLYLPEAWASDMKRRRQAKVPDNVPFATKSQIALEQIRGQAARAVSSWAVRPNACAADQATSRSACTNSLWHFSARRGSESLGAKYE